MDGTAWEIQEYQTRAGMAWKVQRVDSCESDCHRATSEADAIRILKKIQARENV